jgi:hypothetical protein
LLAIAEGGVKHEHSVGHGDGFNYTLESTGRMSPED